MPDPNIFEITDGVLAFELVDVTAAGYDPSWQAPGGATLTDVTLADYAADATTSNWSCQVTSGQITPSANNNDQTIPATFCVNSRVVPRPGDSSFTLDVEFLQQIAIATGLDAFLYANDALEAYFLLGLAGTVTTPAPGINAPKAIGRCQLLAAQFGGAPRTPLTATLSLPLTRKADIAFGSGATVTLVAGYQGPQTAQAAQAAPAETGSTAEPVAA